MTTDKLPTEAIEAGKAELEKWVHPDIYGDEGGALVSDIWTAMEAARPSLGEGWQPIETAPKDGTSVLICWAGDDWGNQLAVAAWDEDYAALDFAEGVGWRDGSDYGCGGMIGAMPTHWMPLPEPPILAMQSNG